MGGVLTRTSHELHLPAEMSVWYSAVELQRTVCGPLGGRQPNLYALQARRAGGGGDDPARDHPWINFGAWGWPRSFSGGGSVIGVNSERAARARLRFADGTRLEDSVDSGVVLFMTDAPVRLPVTVEILDGAGSMLTTYEAFEGN